MTTKTETFEVLVPSLDGTSIAERVPIQVTLEWDEEVKEWLLTPEAHEAIENTQARHMGLLLPAQFRELRDRYGCSQQEMGALFQVGEKSWTRWESGKHRPTRSISLLVRALYDGEISLEYLLTRAGRPLAEASVPLQREVLWSAVCALHTRASAQRYPAQKAIVQFTDAGRSRWFWVIDQQEHRLEDAATPTFPVGCAGVPARGADPVQCSVDDYMRSRLPTPSAA